MQAFIVGKRAIFLGSEELHNGFKEGICIFQKNAQYHLRVFGLEHISQKIGSELNLGAISPGLVFLSLAASLYEPKTPLVIKELYLSKPFCVDSKEDALKCAKDASTRGLSYAIVLDSQKPLGVLRVQDALRANALGLKLSAKELCIKKVLKASKPIWEGIQKLLWFDLPALPIIEEESLIGELNFRVLSIWLGGLFSLICKKGGDFFKVFGNLEDNSFLVGGVVRDFFLKAELPKEVDILILGDAKKVASNLSKNAQIFDDFGTAQLSFENFRLELSSARQETYESPGAYPKVEEGGIAEDLWRRDFSINAMALEIKTRTLIDPCGGLSDIMSRQLRVLHPLSFIEDPVRILRALRFCLRDGLYIEPWSLGLLKSSTEFLKLAPKARIYKEINQILGLIDSPKAIEWLRSTLVFENIFDNFVWESPKRLESLRQLLCEFGLSERFGYGAFILSLSDEEVIKRMQPPRWVRQGFEFLKSKKANVIERLKSSHRPSEVYDVLKPLRDFELSLIIECKDAVLLFRKLKKIKVDSFGKASEEEKKSLMDRLFFGKITKNCLDD